MIINKAAWQYKTTTGGQFSISQRGQFLAPLDSSSKRPKTAIRAALPFVIVIQELHRLHEVRNPHKPLVFASKTTFERIDIKKAWQQALKRAHNQLPRS